MIAPDGCIVPFPSPKPSAGPAVQVSARAVEMDTEEIKEDSVAFTNGWRSEYSEEQDRFYYWNILSPETTQCWELPAEAEVCGYGSMTESD